MDGTFASEVLTCLPSTSRCRSATVFAPCKTIPRMPEKAKRIELMWLLRWAGWLRVCSMEGSRFVFHFARRRRSSISTWCGEGAMFCKKKEKSAKIQDWKVSFSNMKRTILLNLLNTCEFDGNRGLLYKRSRDLIAQASESPVSSVGRAQDS